MICFALSSSILLILIGGNLLFLAAAIGFIVEAMRLLEWNQPVNSLFCLPFSLAFFGATIGCGAMVLEFIQRWPC